MIDPARLHVLIPAAGCSRRLAHLTRERPKALLEVAGRPIIVHGLDLLADRGIERVTFVVGYRREVFMAALGDRHGPIRIEYVVSEDFDTTEHGWSLFLTGESWRRERRPVLFMDADNLYDPAMLDRALASPAADLMLVDERLETDERDEELVLGRDGRVRGLVRGRAAEHHDVAGGFVGINRFSPAFMDGLYDFMGGFFARNGRGYKYERVFDAWIAASGAEVRYLEVGDLAWINVNHEADYAQGERVARRMRAALGQAGAGSADEAPDAASNGSRAAGSSSA